MKTRGILLVTMVLALARLGAQELPAVPKVPAPLEQPPSRPGLQIWAEVMEVMLNSNAVHYSRSNNSSTNRVVVVDPAPKTNEAPTILHCNDLMARRGTNGRIDTIVADGNVEMQQGTNYACGQHAVYYGETEKFVLTGALAPQPLPMLVTSGVTNWGDEIIYDRVLNKLTIRNVKTEIPQSTLQRVNGNENTNSAPPEPAPAPAPERKPAAAPPAAVPRADAPPVDPPLEAPTVNTPTPPPPSSTPSRSQPRTVFPPRSPKGGR